MSLTAATFLALFVSLTLLSVQRSAYAAALYMLPFFAAPQLWWWGDEIPDLRYSFLSGFILLAAVLMHWSRPVEGRIESPGLVHAAAIGMALNATFVHFFLASAPSISFRGYVELLKFILLFFLLCGAIKSRRDFRLVLIAISLGAAYIGYEVTINERGDFNGGRLEGVGAPGADSANSLADLLLITLPLTGSLFVASRIWEKVITLVAAPLALNTLLLCNSRGAFLGLIGSGVSFLGVARGATRKRALQTLALGGLALFLLLGDPQILQRFATTFVGSEERDNSAASRLEFWKAGAAMLYDYPLGDGGNSFKYVRGGYYLATVVGIDEERSLHNGYLTEATSWGIQGLLMQLVLFGAAARAAYRTSDRCRREGNVDDALIGLCVIVAAAGFLIHCFFGSFLGNEWGYWIVAFLVRYSQIYQPAGAATATATTERLAA